MHICCTKNNGIDYLQVQESYYESINGKSKQRKRVIRNLGPLSRFDDGEPNFLYRLRASFRDGKPLIPELNDLVSAPPPPKIKLEYDLNGIAKLLVFGRMLWPDSKLGTFESRDRYLFDVASSVNEREVYRALDCLSKVADAIQKRKSEQRLGAIRKCVSTM